MQLFIENYYGSGGGRRLCNVCQCMLYVVMYVVHMSCMYVMYHCTQHVVTVLIMLHVAHMYHGT